MGFLFRYYSDLHPEAHEQTALDFKVRGPAAAAIPLFEIKVSQKSQPEALQALTSWLLPS